MCVLAAKINYKLLKGTNNITNWSIYFDCRCFFLLWMFVDDLMLPFWLLLLSPPSCPRPLCATFPPPITEPVRYRQWKKEKVPGASFFGIFVFFSVFWFELFSMCCWCCQRGRMAKRGGPPGEGRVEAGCKECQFLAIMCLRLLLFFEAVKQDSGIGSFPFLCESHLLLSAGCTERKKYSKVF